MGISCYIYIYAFLYCFLYHILHISSVSMHNINLFTPFSGKTLEDIYRKGKKQIKKDNVRNFSE